MTNLVPQLVMDQETRELCMQIVHGQYTATLALPDGFGRWSDAAQNAFIEKHAPAMIDGLHKKKLADQRKLKRSLD